MSAPARPPHLTDVIEDKARSDGLYAIAHAILKLEEPAKDIGYQLRSLGLGGAATPMGAIEVLSMEFKRIADAMASLAEDPTAEFGRIADAMESLAANIEEHKP